MTLTVLKAELVANAPSRTRVHEKAYCSWKQNQSTAGFYRATTCWETKGLLSVVDQPLASLYTVCRVQNRHVFTKFSSSSTVIFTVQQMQLVMLSEC